VQPTNTLVQTTLTATNHRLWLAESEKDPKLDLDGNIKALRQAVYRIEFDAKQRTAGRQCGAAKGQQGAGAAGAEPEEQPRGAKRARGG
jgi:hypothetical protein